MTRQTRFDLLIFGLLALAMLLTRSRSISHLVHLPDTIWAIFMIAGFYIRARLAFPALFLLGFAIDLVVIGFKGGTSFCFTPAYWMLLPAYGVMWLAGRIAAGWLGQGRPGVRASALPVLALIVVISTLLAKLLSSGGFYFLSGHFDGATLAGFWPRMTRYYPVMLGSTLLWVALAAAAHALLLVVRTDPRGGRAA